MGPQPHRRPLPPVPGGMRPYVTAQGVMFYAPEGFYASEGAAHTLEVIRPPMPGDQLDVTQGDAPAEMPKPVPVVSAPASAGIPWWGWALGAAVAVSLIRK